MAKPSQDTIDNLIGPVLEIADLRPANDWPPELRTLIGAARQVKALYGFGSVTIRADDPRPVEEILAAHGIKL